MMIAAARCLLTRFCCTMATSKPFKILSESELRALTHESLLEYAIQHVSVRSQNIAKRRLSEESEKTSKHIESEGNNVVNMKGESDIKSSKRRRKQFDMSRYGQRMIALKLNYQGWRFHGFASQKTNENTVESHLFGALLKTRLIESRESCDYSRSGRTDVGVSALGQVIGLRVRSAIVPPSKGDREVDYIKTINSALPDGIRITAWSPVCDGTAHAPHLYDGDSKAMRTYWSRIERSGDEMEADVRRPGELFSARFDATFRSYKYFFARSTLDLSAMSEAAEFFVGKHDFRNFCRIDDNVSNFERVMGTVEIRRVTDDGIVLKRGKGERAGNCEGAEIMEDDGDDTGDDDFSMYYIFVRGQAFLWHQVRCMAAVLFDIGMGREEVTLVRDMLRDAERGIGDFADGRPQYRIASATPLVLYECSYPRSILWFGDVGRDATIINGGGKAKDDAESRVRRSFLHGDGHIAQCWASEAAKCSVLRTILQDNDLMLCPRGNSYGSRGAGKIEHREPGGKEIGQGWKPNFRSDPVQNLSQTLGRPYGHTQQVDMKHGRQQQEKVGVNRIVRNLLMDVNSSTCKYVSYRLRGRDESISQKLARRVEERK